MPEGPPPPSQRPDPSADKPDTGKPDMGKPDTGKPDPTNAGSSEVPTGSSFPVTRWSLVERAGHGSSVVRRQALTELINRYLPALRSHLVLRKRVPPDRADDLLQAFLSDKVLEDRLLKKAEAQRGRFRTFLLTALDHFIISEHRKATARKRSPEHLQSLGDDPEELGQLGVSSEPEPSREFDVAWARQLLSEALAEMQAQCVETHRRDVWGVFEQRVLKPMLEDEPPMDYDQLCKQYDLRSVTQASNVLVTAKRMFIRVLREQIAQYEPDEDAIDEEIGELMKALGGG